VLIIHRMRHEANFSIFANEAIRDGRLSGLARSVLMELLSRPDGWQTNADAMWRKARSERGDRAEGRRAFRAAFAELEEFGYLTRTKRRDGNRYVTVMDLFHLPQDPDFRGTGSGTSETGTSQSGTSETGTSSRSNDHRSTDLESTEEEESAELADARSGPLASSLTREEAAKQQRAHELDRRWKLVDKLTPAALHAALHELEKKRPRIYRDCRQRAIEQYGREHPEATASDVDRLAYKYAILHYAEGVVPMCIAKPIGIAA
jgi:hypothetical protein